MVTFFSINKIYASEEERGFPLWLEGVYNTRKDNEDERTMHTKLVFFPNIQTKNTALVSQNTRFFNFEIELI